jgi:hypothetical protein
MVFLYGRAGRLTAKNGGFRLGQFHTILPLAFLVIFVGRTVFACFVSTFEEMVLGYGTVIFGIATYMAIYATAINHVNDKEVLGVANSMAGMTEKVAQVIMPLFGGIIIETFGIYGPVRCPPLS